MTAFSNVARQCSDPDAVSKLIELLTGVLYGEYFASICIKDIVFEICCLAGCKIMTQRVYRFS